MNLAPDEQVMLDGKQGRARQKAMELLVEYGDALGAERFIDTNNVHLLIGFHFFPQVLISNLDIYDMDSFVSKSVLNTDERVVVDRVKAFTTMHITTVDLEHWDLQRPGGFGDPANFRDLVVGMEEYCRRIGVAVTSACAPYLVGSCPVLGEHCTWTESSSVIYCNAVLGARTNIDGDHTTFASAITGKTVNWGFHLDENRFGNFLVNVKAQPRSIMDWELLAYHAASALGYYGSTDAPGIPLFDNVQTAADMFKLMSFSTATSTGPAYMFHIVGVTPEAHTLEQASGGKNVTKSIDYGQAERKEAYRRLNTSRDDNVEYVGIGCPHYNPERLSVVARLLDGKKVSENVRLLIFTATQHKTLAERSGWLDVIKRAGGHLVTDSCPLQTKMPLDTVGATDSAKIAHYALGQNGYDNFWYGSTEDCIEAAITGKWRGELK